MGAGGNFDHLFDGTRINSSLVKAVSLNAGTRTDKKVLYADSALSGGFAWGSDVDEAITLSFLNM